MDTTEKEVLIKIKKKRGRKPKGGKIIQKKNIHDDVIHEIQENIILHLKCHTKDIESCSFLSELHYNPHIENVSAYSKHTNYSEYNHDMIHQIINNNLASTEQCIVDTKTCVSTEHTENSNNSLQKNTNDINESVLNQKLIELDNQLKQNIHITKKSDCFWCTHPFDSPSIYIPKCMVNGLYEVYGCFCTPECGVAYLYQENIESSDKCERYALMHSLYRDVYKYKTNIKPASNPYYLLEKYYGNLKIEEYRNLSKQGSVVMLLNKPIVRMIPELSTSVDEFDIHKRFYTNSNKTENTKSYRLSRDKGTTDIKTPFNHHAHVEASKHEHNYNKYWNGI